MKEVSLHFDPDSDIDRAKQGRKQQVQVLRHRAQFLEASEKELIEIVFEQSSTFEQIARLTGQNASSINRRFRKLTRKLIAKEFLLILEKGRQLSPLELAIGREYFIHGHSQRKICHKLGCSHYRVQKAIKRMRDYISKLSQQRHMK